MDFTNLRYFFEHKLLPSCFYGENRISFILDLLHTNGAVIGSLMNSVCESEKIECPYTEDDYQMSAYPLSDTTKMIEIQMPPPQRSPLCHRIYLIFEDDLDLEKMAYYTVEMGKDENDFICGWDKEQSHLNYGYAPQTQEEQLLKICLIYFGKNQNTELQ